MSQDGLPTGKISDTINMLVSRMSAPRYVADKQSLPDAEITAELPVLQATFDRGWGDLDGVQNFQSVMSHVIDISLTISSTDFYSYRKLTHFTAGDGS